jgi:hypothetical protein
MPSVDLQKSAGLPGPPEDSNRVVLKVDASDGVLKYNDGTSIRSAGNGLLVKELVLKFDDDGGGAAGVYTASASIPAGATLHDIIVNGVALWNQGTSAAMIVGDATDPNGYYDAIDLKATDLLAGESLSFALAGGQAGAYIANSQVSPRYSASARTITAEVTTVGTAATTGHTRLTILYSVTPAADQTTSSFTAS